MYNWRRMTEPQRTEVLRLRKQLQQPWHSPPHWASDRTNRYHIIAACYEHRPVIGASPHRMHAFACDLLSALSLHAASIHAWAVLPSHYHALVTTTEVKALLAALGRLHGRASFEWNGEDRCRGRQVWCKAAETAMKSEGHFWATMNYVHHNPVHHRFAGKWQEWPFSSAADYLKTVGAKRAEEVWVEYPVLDYGKTWDPTEF